jgi:serine protease AprX
MRINKVAALTLFLSAAVFGKHPNTAPDLPATGTVNVVIQYTAPATAAQHAMVAANGGTLIQTLNSVKGASYTVPAAAIGAIAGDPSVVYISPDRAVASSLEFANPTVNANIAFAAGYTGGGIAIAVIDSGINNHDDLQGTGKKAASRIVYSQSFVAGEDATDGWGHGTHVAGVLAGNGSDSSHDSVTFKGMAQQASLVNLKVLDSNGQGADSAVIAAIEQAVALSTTYNIRVINLSLGRPVFESYAVDPLCQAVEYAWRNGIVVVVAAGTGARRRCWSSAGRQDPRRGRSRRR